jgi:hypothetical protein
MTRMRIIIAAGLATTVLAGCNRDQLEEHDEEAEELCSALCDLSEACGSLSTEHEECVQGCASTPVWTMADGACRRTKIAVSECRMALTCEEFLAQSADSDVSYDDRPCAAERRASGDCIAENR